MRKGTFAVLSAVLALPVLAATAQSATPEATPAADEAMMTEIAPWVCPEGFEGQSLSVYNWSTYVAEDTISNFEALCGVTVSYDVYESNEAMLTRLRQGNPGYDIAVPTNYIVGTMIRDGLLLELNHDNIPNIVNITPSLMDGPHDPGNRFSIPYLWGSIGFGYNLERTGESIDSWAELFAYDGPVAWLEDPRQMMGSALRLAGFDPNSSDPAEIAAARDLLMANGGNVVAIAQDDGQVLLERGDVDVTIEYSGDIFQVIAACECDTFGYGIPEEGSSVWVDNMVVLEGAPNPALAEVFIDYILHPQVAADIANFTQFASPNQAAIDAGLIDEAMLSNPGMYPTQELLDNLFFIEDNPDIEVPIATAWEEIKITLGR
jgi:spermidine/putrescine transport system substrate-binding protein